MNDADLMRSVRQRAGQYLYAFAPSCSVPEPFWAALTANESGGNRQASRFEPGVYAHLEAVAAGQARAYGSITAPRVDQLAAKTESFHTLMLDEAFASRNRAKIAAAEDPGLRALATSWGFTQLMGYHALDFGSIADIQDPVRHFYQAAELLAQFCARYALDPRADFEAMFRCWNSGRPDGQTYDPNYVQNGMNRMTAWTELSAV